MTKQKVNNSGELIIYSGRKGGVELRADADRETIWATLNQIGDLFDVQKAAISKHLKNIFEDGELSEETTVSKMETVQKEGNRSIKRQIEFYNLDAIIAVGYRVNSKQATQFRIWATKTLREYLTMGLVVNADRIKKLPDRIINDLIKKVSFIERTLHGRDLKAFEAGGVMSVVKNYAHSWKSLKEYDEGSLALKRGKAKERRHFDYEFVRSWIDVLKSELIKKNEASDLFASERDGSFQGIIQTIYQTFGGKELYPSLEEKAAHLMYFIIKDHPFSDGNKRVGAFLFVSFLQLNGILLRSNGEKKINDNTLVALALLIAESDPKDKDMMVALVTNLLV